MTNTTLEKELLSEIKKDLKKLPAVLFVCIIMLIVLVLIVYKMYLASSFANDKNWEMAAYSWANVSHLLLLEFVLLQINSWQSKK